MSASNPGAGFVVATTAGQVFPNASNFDFVIHTTGSTRKILFGHSNGVSPATLVITSNNMGVRTSNPTYPLDVVGDINFTGVLRQNGAPYVGSQWSNVASNVFLLGSNVGIGTNAPRALLEVAASNNGQYQCIVTNAGGSGRAAMVVRHINGTNWFAFQQFNSGQGSIENQGAFGIGYYARTNTGTHTFYVGDVASNAMFIANNTNVGIGASNPGYRLDVAGDINFTGTLRSNGVPFIGGGGSQWSNVSSNVVLLGSNVGIGTSNPQTRLHVNGGVIVQENNTLEFGWGLTKEGNAGKIGYQTFTDGLDIVGAGTAPPRKVNIYDNLVVQGSISTVNGNLGIGTSNPSQKLEVAGNLFLNTTGAELTLGSNNNNSNVGAVGGRIVFGGTFGDPNYVECVIENRIWSSPEMSELLLFKANDPYNGAGPDRIRLRAAEIVLDTYNTDTADRVSSNVRLVVDPDGDVGIGTTAPAALLDVNGTSRFRDTMTFSNTTSWAAAPANGVTGGTGTRIVLWPGSATTTPYAFGINASTLWYSVPTGTTHLWYNGTTAQMQLNSGALICTGDITAFGSVSDSNLKTNVQPLLTSLDIVSQLRPVTFQWKEDIFNEAKRGTPDVGFLAQEVEPHIPLAVGEFKMQDVDQTYKSLRHERFIPYLVGAVQELRAQVIALQQEVAQLKAYKQ